MTSIGASAVQKILSRRIAVTATVTVLVASAFFALATSWSPDAPLSGPAPTATVLSPFAVLEPSTRNNPNDKDGYPPTKSEADPEEAFMVARIETENDLFDPHATLVDYSLDSVDDLVVDDDSPRSLDILDGVSDGRLAAGTYYVYWNVNKTGYVPVNTSAGDAYNGSNSASISIVDDIEGFKVNLTYSETESGSPLTVWSDMYTVTMDKSSSVGQNDLEWLDTEPKVVFAKQGDLFTVRSKYQQSSAQGLDWLILQSYYNGMYLRMRSVSFYFYDNRDPGSIVDGVPAGWDNRFVDQQQFTGADLGDTDNKDFWITEYTFEVRQVGFSDLIPYIQTKKGGDTWKVDTGYRGFRSRVPGGINPAKLEISKYFSEDYPGGVVSGPNPPIVGLTTTYELNITVGNVGADVANSVLVTDVAQLENVTWLNEYAATQGTLVFDPGTGEITWSVGSLAVNGTATLSYRVSATPTLDMALLRILLNAGASASGRSGFSHEPIFAGPTDGLYTEPVTGVPAMALTKTADRSTANPGDEITYTLHYANGGSGTAYDVVVQDTLPDHVTYVTSSPAYDDVSGRTYSWDLGNVASGASGEITLVVQVDTGTADGTLLPNSAVVTYTGPGGEPEPPGGGGTNVTVTAPVMSFHKTVDVATADPGDSITYTLAYHNTGTGAASGVVLTDTLPDHVTFVSSVPAYTGVSGRTYTFDIGDVAAGASGTVTIVVTVDAGTPDGAVLTNTAVIDYDDSNGNPYPPGDDSASTTVTAPVVSFSKTADLAFADPGDVITYTLTAHNSGTGDASGLILKDTIPEHTTFLSATPAYTGASGTTYTWSLGTLAAGGTATVTLKVTVDAFTADATVLLNTATLDYADANGNYYPQLSDEASTGVTAPVMTFSKTADVEFADPGDLITYTIAYVNGGSGAATAVVIRDTIPASASFQSCSPAYSSVSGRTYTWDIGTVGPTSSGTVTVVVKVNAGVPDETVVTNAATLDYADANGNSYPQQSDGASTTVTAPVMTFSKTADVGFADPGDLITYTLHYKNTGTGEATGVVVQDPIPEHTTYFSSTPAYDSVSGRTYTWDVGTVGAGVEGDIVLRVIVDAAVADGTVLTNTAILISDDANGNPNPQLSDDATTTVTAPIVSFEKDADVEFADPGDPITYTLTFHNSGTGWATALVVTDTLPDRVTFQSASPWYDSVSARTYTWNAGSLGPGATGTITVTVTVDAGTLDETLLANSATFDYEDANGNSYPQQTDGASTTVTAPVMSFSKTADVAYADPGDLITYTLHYKNSGTGEATGVALRDTIPFHVTLLSATPAYDSVSGRTYTWDIGVVGAGVEGTVTVKVSVVAGTADKTVLTNTATFDYDDANGNPYEQIGDHATTTVTAPVMTLTKVADLDTANPGDIVTFTISYENLGTGLASSVVVVDVLPSHMVYVDATPAPGSVSGGVVEWDIGDVPAGASASITLEAQIEAGTPDGTLLHNAATLDYDDANGNPLAQLTASYDVTTSAPVMSFSKSADVTTADPGDEIVYTLHYANTGGGKATGVVVVDTIPEHVTFVAAVPYPDSVSGRVLTWNVGTVAAHSSGDITVTVKVDAYTEDGTFLVNTATFDYDDANGNPYEQLGDEAQTTVTAPILHMTKVADVDTADPGDLITYTITFHNSGSGSATGVVVTDTLPEHVTFVSSTPGYDAVEGATYTWDAGTVGAEGTGTITIVVEVDAGTADATLLHNTASLTYADANGNPYPTLSDEADVTVTAPVVDLTKTSDTGEADPGDYVTYTITFTNSGTGNATDVLVIDTIPLHVAFVSSDPAYADVSGRTYTWHWDVVPAGSSVTVSIVVKVDAYTPDETLLHNAATADYDDDNGNPFPTLTAYADVAVTAPVFTFEKTADVSTADPGDTITYTLAWANTGTGWASGVEIRDTIPGYVIFVTSSPDYASVVGRTYSFPLGDVAPGASGQVLVIVEVQAYTPDETVLHNTASLDFSDANGNPYPQLGGYADVAVTAPVMSEFTKTGDVSTADPGDPITYTLCYENRGTGDAAFVVVTDTLPGGVTFLDATPAPDAIEGSTLTWNVGTVSGGGEGCIVVLVQVEPGTADRTLLHNTAGLAYDDANGNPYPRLEAYWDVRVTAPVMSFSKGVDVATADPGDLVTYTLAYENTGTGEASAVTIVDTLPAEVTFVSATLAPDSIVGGVLTWNLGDVPSMSGGSIEVTVQVGAGTPDKTVLHNAATLDYSDANGNPVETLEGSADATVTAPVMTLEKTAGNVTIKAYVLANFTLRIAGEKWHDVVLSVIDNGVVKSLASVTRYPGSPDDQSVTVTRVKIDVLNPYSALIRYTPWDDPVNGQPWGDDPCWLTLTFPSGRTVRLFHNFNVKHNGTWNWTIPDFLPYVKGEPILTEANIPYTITYANTGTGDASGVVVTDVFQAGSEVADADPAYDACSGGVCTWTIGAVAAGSVGHIFVNVTYPFDINGTVVVNEAILDYSDANGNFVEELHALAYSILYLPKILGTGPGPAEPYLIDCWPAFAGDVGLLPVAPPDPLSRLPPPAELSTEIAPAPAGVEAIPGVRAEPGTGGEATATPGQPLPQGGTGPIAAPSAARAEVPAAIVVASAEVLAGGQGGRPPAPVSVGLAAPAHVRLSGLDTTGAVRLPAFGAAAPVPSADLPPSPFFAVAGSPAWGRRN